MRRRNLAVVVIGLLLLAAAFLPVPATAVYAETNSDTPYGAISVYGEAVITAQPDAARVILAVETTHKLAKKAAEENAGLTAAVLEALVKLGLDEKELKTSGYRLNSFSQQTDPKEKDQYVTMYRAYNELNVNLHNLDAVGSVIDTAVKAGANRVISVVFELQDAEALKLQALQNATTQARAKAEAIARSAGVKIKGIKVINEEMSGYSPYRVAMEESVKTMGAAGGSPTPILPGDVEVTARIRAEYYF